MKAPDASKPESDGRISGPDASRLARLAADGVSTVEDVLRRAEGVRDLPVRANYRLRAAGLLVFVKRGKPRGPLRRIAWPPPEAAGIAALRAAGVPTADLVFSGADPRLGSVVGTLDLAPARPLDALLREGRVAGGRRRLLRRALAHAVARLHRAGLHHKDLYLNHVFADADASPPRLALLDLERVGRHARTLSRWVVKDLAALLASSEGLAADRERSAFLAAYRRERGIRFDATRLVRRVARKARRIRAHVPRTPVGAAARRPEPIPAR